MAAADRKKKRPPNNGGGQPAPIFIGDVDDDPSTGNNTRGNPPYPAPAGSFWIWDDAATPPQWRLIKTTPGDRNPPTGTTPTSRVQACEEVNSPAPPGYKWQGSYVTNADGSVSNTCKLVKDDSGAGNEKTRQSAYDTLVSWLDYFGIDNLASGATSLSSLIWGWVQQDKSLDWIKLELRKTEQYKARFPGMDALSKKGMAISEAEYISNERAYLQVLKAAGMPKGFYDDRQDFANFMVAEVSPQELASRVQIAKDYVQLYAPQSVKDQLRGLYGFTNDQMAAYVLDTSQDKMKSLAAIEAEYTTRKAQAQVGGAAIDAGYGLSTTLRDQIAAMGYDYNQSAAGIYRTQQQANPYARLGSLYGEQTSTDELLQETFGLGGAAETATKKKKLASRERAAFSGTSAIGASSLGTNQAGRV